MTDSKVKVAILGVGNCASSFVQGLQYYKDKNEENGLISDVIGGYRVSDIEVVCAFDINKSKVGKDLSEAIFIDPNNTVKFAEVPNLGVKVKPGRVLDGIGKFVENIIDPTDDSENIIEDFYLTPDYFEKDLNTKYGSGFSIQPKFSQSAYFRFHNKSEIYEGLYFVGAGTHPGAGVPGVLSSAKVLDKIL